MRKNKGFTLIELLVVIAIIGILASIVLASLNSARKKGRDARRVADIKQLQLALEMYFDSSNNQYPTGDIAALTALKTSGYIAAIPSDPLAGKTYFYQSTNGTAVCSTAPCTSYHLGADLEENGTTLSGTGGNAALSSDVDSTIGFNGQGADCSAAGTDDGCYDITP